MRVRKEYIKKNGTKKKSCQVSLLSERVFDARLDSFLVPSYRIPRALFSRQHWQHQLGEPRAGGGIDWRSILRARANLATGESSRYTQSMGKEQREKGSLVYIPILLQSPPSLPFILRNPTNRRLRVCGSAASPRLCSRSHNSFDRRTERFRFVENGNTNVSKLTCAPFHRFTVIIRRNLLFVVFESTGCTCLQEFARHLISLVHGGRCSPAETRTMRFSWMFVATVLLVLLTEARCKRKFDGDFEFAEEVSLIYFIYDYMTFLVCLLSYVITTGQLICHVAFWSQ